MFKVPNFIKNFFIYSFGAIVLKGISILIMPIIMRILTPADYGLLALNMNFIDILEVLASFGMKQFLLIEYFHHDSAGRKKIINDILTIYLFWMIPVFLFLYCNLTLINNVVFVGKAWSLFISLSLLVAFLKFFVDIFYQTMQYVGAATKLTVIKTIAGISILVCNLAFLYTFSYGVIGVVVSQLISSVFIFLIAFFAYTRSAYHIDLHVFESVKKSLWYIKRGLPFIPRILFAWVLAVGDRWILAKYSTMHNVGIYSVADMFGQLFQFVIILPISYAYIPPLLEKFSLQHASPSTNVSEDMPGNWDNILSIDRWNQKNMWLCMAVVFVLISISYIVFRPIVYIIFPPKFHEAFRYVWLLLVGYIFLLGTYFSSALLQFQKKVFFLVFSLFVPAVLNVVLNIILVPRFDIFGCVFATFISYLIYFVIVLGYNQYIKKLPLKKAAVK